MARTAYGQNGAMNDAGGSVTLIFYKIHNLWQEPFLNVLAAAAQMSAFTHVEVAIGDEAGNRGQMSNVARVFNDAAGVELTSRTGRNPQYSYLSIGCSKRAENAMLAYAQSVVGRPFSNYGMARSVIYPRTTDGASFFCAELVAAILKAGGLMASSSNPGAATPEGLHRLYKHKAAITANPYTLRQFGTRLAASKQRAAGLSRVLDGLPAARSLRCERQQPRRNQDSPPRQALRYVSLGARPEAKEVLFFKH